MGSDAFGDLYDLNTGEWVRASTAAESRHEDTPEGQLYLRPDGSLYVNPSGKKGNVRAPNRQVRLVPRPGQALADIAAQRKEKREESARLEAAGVEYRQRLEREASIRKERNSEVLVGVGLVAAFTAICLIGAAIGQARNKPTCDDCDYPDTCWTRTGASPC